MSSREGFKSELGALLAAAGSAVGLGNIWRFPIECGQNGGAAYILVYILCIILLGLPVMMSEFILGKTAKCNSAMVFSKFTSQPLWKYLGLIFIITALVISSYYAVVAGWTLEYLYMSITDQFSGKSSSDFQPLFDNFTSNPYRSLVCTLAIFIITHFIVSRGVRQGIEKYSKVLMPTLFMAIIVLVICSVSLEGASEGINFLLHPDFTKIDSHITIDALGQAFYSLSLGMGCLITYASYFNKDTNLTKTGINVCIIDTVVAVMAGFIIFPAMFNAGHGISPEDVGPSLIFITLPNIFQECFSSVPIIGYLFAVLFFFLLLVSAITSLISLHEVITSFITEKYSASRRRAAIIVTSSYISLGILCALSFGLLKDFTIAGMTIFSLFDFLSSNVLLPFGGLATSVFVGWVIDKKFQYHYLTYTSKARTWFFFFIRFMIRYVVPFGIGFILIHQFGFL